jgi:hypothetical protein
MEAAVSAEKIPSPECTGATRERLDLAARLLPTALSMGVLFTSRRPQQGEACLMASSPSSWMTVQVPHLSRNEAHIAQIPTDRIAGRIVRCAVMLCNYCGSSGANGAVGGSPQWASSGPAGSYGPVSIDYDRDASFFVSEQSNTSAVTHSVGTNRMVVFSVSDLNDGELRLYDLVSHQHLAIIRLTYFTKV